MTRATKAIRGGAAGAVLALALSQGLGAQGQAATQPPPKAVVPVKVDIVLSRYQGDKKTSSLPFTLLVNFNDRYNPQTSVRMGVDIPVGTVSTTSANGAVTTTKPDYRNVGTSIDCRGTTTDDGRYALYVNIVDQSVYTPDADSRAVMHATDPAAFRTFSTSNNVTLRDGQTLQFTMATDKISGEVLKVEVTATALK